MSLFKKEYQPVIKTTPKNHECVFCANQATCKYKAKFERLKKEFKPMRIECQYFKDDCAGLVIWG